MPGRTSITADATSGGLPGLAPAPARTFRLIHRPGVLDLHREVVEFEAGLTIAEMVDLAQADPMLRRYAVVVIAGEVVPRAMWARVRPKPGALLSLTVMPQGANVLRTVLTIAVIAAATYATGGLAAAGYGAFTVAAAGAAITTVGMLAINALVPPPQPDMGKTRGQSSPTYALEGARNQARLWRPIPRILGRHKVVPALAAPTITETHDNNLDLRMLVCWGYGPLDIDNLRIGQTELSAFPGFRVEKVEGTPGELATLDLYPNAIVPESMNVPLTQEAGWVTVTTAPDTKSASVDITFPQGLIKYGKKTGDRIGRMVEFEIRYRLVGGDDWTVLKDETGDDFGRTEKTSAVVRWTFDLPLEGTGQFDIQLRRKQPDVDPSEAQDVSFLTMLRSYQYGNPVKMPGIALTALYLPASATRNGYVDDLSGIVTSICKDWDRDEEEWVERPTRNPASLYRHLLQGNGTKRKVADRRIDLAKLQYWHELCDDKGWTCDLVLDSDMGRWEALRMVAACGRASPSRSGSKRSVVIDEPQPLSLGLYTPKNMMRGFQGRRIFVDLPHALRVKFTDETQDYAVDERLVFMDGYNKTNASKFEEWELPGITHPDLIHQFGRFHLACAVLRQETYQIPVDWERLAHERGDRIDIATDIMSTGTAAGRIKSVLSSGGSVISLTINETVIKTPGVIYGARIRYADGKIRVYRIQNDGSASKVLTFADEMDLEDAPGIGDLVHVGEYRRDVMPALINGIRPRGDLGATLLAIPYHPGCYTADEEEIPAWEPNVTAAAGSLIPRITSIRSDESVLQRDADGSAHLQIVVSLFDDGSRPLTRIAQIQLRFRPVGSGGAYRFATAPAEASEIVLPGVEAGEEYEISGRYLWIDGKPGEWSRASSHAVRDPELPPPDPLAYLAGDRIEWKITPVPPDLAGYRARYTVAAGQDWDTALPLTDGLYTTAYVLLAEIPAQAVDLLIKAETTAEVQSEAEARVRVQGLPRPRAYPAYTYDLGLRSFPGTLTGGERAAGTVRALDASIWGKPKTKKWGSPKTALWGDVAWTTFTYEFEFVCPAIVRSTDQLLLELVYAGEIYAEYRWVSDVVSYFADDDGLPDDTFTIPPDWVPFGATGEGESARPWRPWRDGLRPVAGESIQFRVSGRGGTAVRPVISAARVVVEAPEIQEARPNFAIGAGGTRLTPTQAFRAIEWVHATLHKPSPAITVGTLDKLTLGPKLAAYTADDQQVAATADVLLGGW